MKKYIKPGMEITYFVTESIMENGEPAIIDVSALQPAMDPENMGTAKSKVAGINLADIY